jgi:hypothetical protein
MRHVGGAFRSARDSLGLLEYIGRLLGKKAPRISECGGSQQRQI